MSEATNKLLSLLKDSATVENIKKEMNLTNSQLMYRLSMLKMEGYMVEHNYYGNGDITVSLSNSLPSKYAKIYTRDCDSSLKHFVMSDLHYFHKYESQKALDTAFNYCTKNAIHIIFLCGDLIDCRENNKVPIEEQAERFIELYPEEKNIITFCVLGNHDIKYLKNTGKCFKNILARKRFDIVPINYYEAGIKIKRNAIFLEHNFDGKATIYNEKNGQLIYRGHSHIARINGKTVSVPSLSYVRASTTKNFKFIPQAFDSEISFTPNGAAKKVVINQLNMEEEPYVTNETIINLQDSPALQENLVVESYPSLQRKK